MSVPLAARRPRRSVVVLAGDGGRDDSAGEALAEALGKQGVETTYIGREGSARRIADVVAEEQADSVELCVAGRGGVLLVRDLLRELTACGRRGVGIVVHKLG